MSYLHLDFLVRGDVGSMAVVLHIIGESQENQALTSVLGMTAPWLPPVNRGG